MSLRCAGLHENLCQLKQMITIIMRWEKEILHVDWSVSSSRYKKPSSMGLTKSYNLLSISHDILKALWH